MFSSRFQGTIEGKMYSNSILFNFGDSFFGFLHLSLTIGARVMVDTMETTFRWKNFQVNFNRE